VTTEFYNQIIFIVFAIFVNISTKYFNININ